MGASSVSSALIATPSRHPLVWWRPPLGNPSLRGPLRLLVSFVVPLVAAGIMTAVRAHVPDTSLALVMVAVVVATVTPGRRVPALLAGISAGLWFDFFLTKPYESFSIRRSADLQTTILLLVVAVAVGEIAVRRRGHSNRSTATRSDLSGLQAVARMLAAGSSPQEVIATVNEVLISLLSLQACTFEASTKVPAPYVAESGLLEYNNFSWDTSVDGLPNRDVTLPVEAAGRVIGRFVLRGPQLGVPIPADRLLTAIALADLTGAVIETHEAPTTRGNGRTPAR